MSDVIQYWTLNRANIAICAIYSEILFHIPSEENKTRFNFEQV